MHVHTVLHTNGNWMHTQAQIHTVPELEMTKISEPGEPAFTFCLERTPDGRSVLPACKGTDSMVDILQVKSLCMNDVLQSVA